MEDYYKILGIHPDSSFEDIKEAYRRKAHKYHPDKGGDSARFKEIQKAFDVLSDTNQRIEYNATFGRKTTSNDFQGSYQNESTPPQSTSPEHTATKNRTIAIVAIILVLGIGTVLLWNTTNRTNNSITSAQQSSSNKLSFSNSEIEELLKKSVPQNYALYSYELTNLDDDSENEYLVLYEEHKLYNPNSAKETEGIRTLPVSISIGDKTESGTWKFTPHQPINTSEFPSDYFYAPYFLDKPFNITTDTDGDKVLAIYSYKFSMDGYSFAVDIFRFNSEYGITPVGKSEDTSYYPIVKIDNNLVFTVCNPFFDEDGLMNIITLNLTTFNGRNYTSEANISCEKYSDELFELIKSGIDKLSQEALANRIKQIFNENEVTF